MNRFRRTLHELFGFDLRSLALFRICLGTLIIVDLLNRSRDLVAHYCDDGVLPREALLQLSSKSWHISLHMISGDPLVQAALFGFAAVVAVLLTLGYRTWLMTLLSWVMMVSLHARNPVILNGGDVEFRVLLFWSLFLPLGARWSIDRLLDKSTSVGSQQHLSLGTFGYTCQIMIIYLFAALLKDGETWVNGTAVHYAMEIDIYGKSLRHLLLPHPGLMKFLTYCTLYLEQYGWLLLLVPWKQAWFRLLTICLFVGMHLSFFLTMTLGMFPWICMAAWIPLLPGMIWDRWIPASAYRWCLEVAGQRIAWVVERLEQKQWLRPRPVRLRLGEFGSTFAFFYLVLVAAWNVQSLGDWKVPEPFRTVTRYPRVGQQWKLFAPNPFKNDGWYIVAAQLADGREIDLLTQGEVTFEKPEYPARLFPNHRWRKYFRNLLNKKYKEHRRWYARYAGRTWNRRHRGTDQEAETLRLIYMQEATDLQDHSPKIAKKVLWRHWYREEFKSRFYPGRQSPTGATASAN